MGVGLLVRSAVVWGCMVVGGAGVVRNDVAACGSMVGGDMAVPGVLWSVVIWRGPVYYGRW